MPEINKFVGSWVCIWEKNERTPNMPWIKKVKRFLVEKFTVINEFDIEAEKLKKEINKRKNWKTPGIDGVQHFWWKKLVAAQKVFLSAFKTINSDNNMIPRWLPIGRTVLKTKDLSDEKDYLPKTCLNTKYERD